MLPDDHLLRTGEYTVGATGLIFLVFSAIRKMIRTISADSLNATQESVQKNTLTSLHEEILRLEQLIKGMQGELDSLHRKSGQMKKIMLEAQVALVEVEIKFASCKCESVEGIRTDLASVRNKLLEIEL